MFVSTKKIKIQSILLGNLLLLLLVNCSIDNEVQQESDEVDITVQEGDEIEEVEVDCSNCFECATIIDLNVNVSGQIEKEGEFDYFKFAIYEDGILNINFSESPENLRIKSDLFNDNCEGIYSENAVNEGEVFATQYFIEKGDYVIRISDFLGNTNVDDYSFTINLETDIDDSCIDANEIIIGNEISTAIFPVGDVDYFNFSTTQAGVVKIDIYDVPSNINLQASLKTTSNCSELIGQSNENDGAGFSLFYLTEPGDFVLEINDIGNNAFNPELFTFLVTLNVSDIYEVNNSCSTAKNIVLDREIKAAIYPEYDLDYFKFTTSEVGVIKVDLYNVPENIDMQVTLRSNSDCTILTEEYNFRKGQGLSLFYTTIPGEYILEINDIDNNDFNSELYSLTVTLDTNDTYEINDACSDAKNISLNTEINASIYPLGDVDYFRFAVNQTGVYEIQIYDIPENININATLRTDDCEEIVSEFIFNNGGSLSLLRQLGEGEYILQLSDISNDASNDELYSLIVSMQ